MTPIPSREAEGRGAQERHPLPWRAERAANGHTAIYPDGSRERVADIYCPLDVPGYINASAAFIVQAVNAHDALVAALRAIVQITDGSQPKDYPSVLHVARHALKQLESEA